MHWMDDECSAPGSALSAAIAGISADRKMTALVVLVRASVAVACPWVAPSGRVVCQGTACDADRRVDGRDQDCGLWATEMGDES